MADSDDGFELAVDGLADFGEPQPAEKEKEDKVEAKIAKEEQNGTSNSKDEVKVAEDEKVDSKPEMTIEEKIKANKAEAKKDSKVETQKTSGDEDDPLTNSLLNAKKTPEVIRSSRKPNTKKVNKAAQVLAEHKARNSSAQSEGYVWTGEGPCNNFRLDVNAKEFGVCVYCGYKQKDHKAQTVNKAQEALKKLKNKNKEAYQKKKKFDGPCDNFLVDTSAAEFGICFYCGFKKEDHVIKKENAAAKLRRELYEKNEAKRRESEAKMMAAEAKQAADEAAEKAEVEKLDKEETKAVDPPVVKKKKGKTCICS